MSRRSTAIVLSPEVPYPAAGGGALRTACILEYLKLRYETTVIVFRQPEQPDPRLFFPPEFEVHVIDLPYHSKAPVMRAARNLRRACLARPPLVDRFAGFEDQVKTALRERSFDAGVIEHFWCAGYAQILRPACRLLALDLHNIESILLRRQAVAERGVSALLLNRFSSCCARMERAVLPRFDALLVTSQADAAHLAAGAAVVPNAIPLIPQPERVKHNVIAMSGNFDYQPNQAGVRWFAAEIWPRLRETFPELRWRLIGRGENAVMRALHSDPRIEATGPLNDPVAELARCRISVVPLLSGSGTRIKIIEAWAAGLPVVSTTLGAEGMPGQPGVHWLSADTPETFACAVEQVLADPALAARLGHAGRQLYEDHLTWGAAHQALQAAGL
ncbi:MAG TPA: glycosyltransferase [Bryobacteraceae bacterium]|nr:glycosyltransferase [Bryobacteraceae bacterium]